MEVLISKIGGGPGTLNAGRYHIKGDCGHQARIVNQLILEHEPSRENRVLWYDNRPFYPCGNCFGDNFARSIKVKPPASVWPPE